MICENCKGNVPEGQGYCPNCGTPVNAAPYQQMYQQTYQQQSYAQPTLTRREFYKHPDLKPVSREIHFSAVFLYVAAVLNMIAMSVGGSGILDIAIMIACGVTLQVLQSRASAIVLMVYAVLNMIISLIAFGRLGGWLFLIVGIEAIRATFKFHKLWEEYKRTGIIPFVAKK